MGCYSGYGNGGEGYCGNIHDLGEKIQIKI
jgi:hypothetical protein